MIKSQSADDSGSGSSSDRADIRKQFKEELEIELPIDPIELEINLRNKSPLRTLIS